jgi:NO-binding membrane sensor protein with MHYT domain
MPVVHHFAHGPVNPAAAYALAFLGSLLGLASTARATASGTSGRRARWLVIAAFSIGGGIWLMHFTAMLGFDIPDSPVRYDPRLTLTSAILAVLVVGLGLAFVGTGRRALWKLLAGGTFTGIGVAAMHYTGMAAMHVTGSVGYQPQIVAASVLIAIAAATVALWLSVTVRGRGQIFVSAGIMALAVCGMHYTGMAALDVHLVHDGTPVAGMDPIVLILPIVVSASVALVALAFGALQTVTVEDFARPATPVRRPATRPLLRHPVSLAEFNATMPIPYSSTVASHDGKSG